MSPDDILKTVFERNAFYRRLYLLALGVFGLSLVVMAVLMYEIHYLRERQAMPLYFATDKVGRLINVIPENVPNMPPEERAAWVVEAVQAAYSYDYVNFRSQMQNAQKYFIQNPGWTEYMKALTRSNNLVSMQQQNGIFIAQVVDEPKLKFQGTIGKSAAWLYEVNVLISYWKTPYEDTPWLQNSWTVSVKVMRQPVLQSYRGLGIVQMVARAATAQQDGG